MLEDNTLPWQLTLSKSGKFLSFESLNLLLAGNQPKLNLSKIIEVLMIQAFNHILFCRVVDTASLSTEIITGHTDTVLSIDTQVRSKFFS